jgi:hypothetical protein
MIRIETLEVRRPVHSFEWRTRLGLWTHLGILAHGLLIAIMAGTIPSSMNQGMKHVVIGSTLRTRRINL